MFVCSTSVLGRPLRSFARFSTSVLATQYRNSYTYELRPKKPIGINRIELLGTIESTPEKTKDERTGREYVTFPLVTRVSWDRRDGSFGVNEDYHNVFIAKPAQVNWLINRNIGKGSVVLVVGRMSYEEGENNTRTPVVNADTLQEMEPSDRFGSFSREEDQNF